MKLGLSIYSLVKYLRDGSMDVLSCMDFAREAGFSHIEMVPFFIPFLDENNAPNRKLLLQVAKKSADIGLPVSVFSVGADLQKTGGELEAEKNLLKAYAEAAHLMGAGIMRFDCVSYARDFAECGLDNFLIDLDSIAENCREIADFAHERFGIVTTLENHGYYANGAERVYLLVEAVGRPYFRHTLDVGNFLCVNEDPRTAARQTLPLAACVHLKDFYVRSASLLPKDADGKIDAGGFFTTRSGHNHLCGAIVGYGDMPLGDILADIKASGFNGPVAIEFEGLEEPRFASSQGRKNALYLWDKA